MSCRLRLRARTYKKKKTVNKIETAVVGRNSRLEIMLPEDVGTVYGSMAGDAEEGLCVITSGGSGGLQTPGKSFLAKGMISKTQGACRSDPGVKVIGSKDTRAAIKEACDALGIAHQAFTHRSLRKNYASGMNDRARAYYAEFISKHTTGAGQWTEGSEVIQKHYIASDTQGMLSCRRRSMRPVTSQR